MKKRKNYKDLLKQQLDDFDKVFFGYPKMCFGDYDGRIDELYEKYGDALSINCTVVGYEDLTGAGKELVKNVPIGSFYEGTDEPIVIGKDIHAIEVYAKCVRYDTRTGRIYVLGGVGDNAKLFSYKVVFGSKVDPRRLGYFKDAMLFTKEEFAKFSIFELEGYPKTKEDGVSV